MMTNKRNKNKSNNVHAIRTKRMIQLTITIIIFIKLVDNVTDSMDKIFDNINNIELYGTSHRDVNNTAVTSISRETHQQSSSDGRNTVVTSISRETQQSQPKPKQRSRIIFHVGPAKTATTTIQCSLTYLEQNNYLSKEGIKLIEVESCRPDRKMRNSLMKKYQKQFPNVTTEDIEYVDPADPHDQTTTYKRIIIGSSWIPQCFKFWEWLKSDKGQQIPHCWSKSYLKIIQNYHRQHKHQQEGEVPVGTSSVITPTMTDKMYNNDTTKQKQYTTFVFSNENIANIISESLSSESCTSIFNDMLSSLGDEFDIELILTYRRLWEMYLSYFGQQYGKDAMSRRPMLSKWPGSGGKSVPTKTQFFSNKAPINMMNVVKCLQIAADDNPGRIKLHIINFHHHDDNNSNSSSSTDVLRNFLKIMPVTDDVSNSWINHLNKNMGSMSYSATSSQGYHVGYDRIATEAFNTGIISKSSKISRGDSSNKIGEYCTRHNLSWKDFPRVCPSTDFELDLFNKSFDIERTIFQRQQQKEYDANKFHGVLEEKLLYHFNETIQSKKFCDVDASAVLNENKELKDFLSNL